MKQTLEFLSKTNSNTLSAESSDFSFAVMVLCLHVMFCVSSGCVHTCVYVCAVHVCLCTHVYVHESATVGAEIRVEM